MTDDKPPENDPVERALRELKAAESREREDEAELIKDHEDVAKATEKLEAAEKERREHPKGPPSHEHRPGPPVPSKPPHHRQVG